MNPQIQERILTLLDRVERDRGIDILYACESGSRAWGFASPDSDYDIRFLFRRPEEAYLSVFESTDAFDLPMEGDLDAGGWDIRKALGLLGKSNGALVEWLHSPIVYQESPGFLDRWRSASREVFEPKFSVDHYRGLAKQMVFGKLQGDHVRARIQEIRVGREIARSFSFDRSTCSAPANSRKPSIPFITAA